MKFVRVFIPNCNKENRYILNKNLERKVASHC